MEKFNSIKLVKVLIVPRVDETYYELFKDDFPTGIIYSASHLNKCYSKLLEYERTNND